MELHDVGYKVSYRDVKYPRLEFRTGELLVVLPFGHDLQSVLEKHKKWILKKAEFIEECLKESGEKEIIDREDEEFKDLVYSYVEEVSKELKVQVNKVFFRRMKTKWASCSSRGNLTINKLMKYLPAHLIEYVVFHEIAHLLEKRHTARFWKLISKKFPNHNELEKELFAYWFLVSRFRKIIRRTKGPE
jgi:hypothetical protein